MVRCESHAVRSQVLRAQGSPEFNLRAIFYRRYPDAPITIQVGLPPVSSPWCFRLLPVTPPPPPLPSAAVGQGSPPRPAPRQGSAPDRRAGDGLQPRDRPAGRPSSGETPGVRLRGDVLQRLSHGPVIPNEDKKQAKVLKLDTKQAVLHGSAGQIFSPDPSNRICQIYKCIFKMAAAPCCLLQRFSCK